MNESINNYRLISQYNYIMFYNIHKNFEWVIVNHLVVIFRMNVILSLIFHLALEKT